MVRARTVGLALALGLGLGAPSASATWSIVVANPRTGEVAAASATCLAGFDLATWTPVLRVGEGAACAQATLSGIDTLRDIREGLKAGLAPQEIFDGIDAEEDLTNRQFGIVSMTGEPLSFSGNGVCPGIGNVTGSIGPLTYAIQGNILTGAEPVLAAEQALRVTRGDLGQKLMAAMKAARRWGGDGRCSCPPSTSCDGTVCGAPPTNYHPGRKSAHVGFLFVARIGNKSGPCSEAGGCAAGDYYTRIEYVGQKDDPDPVDSMEFLYEDWRSSMQGRPDQLLSEVTPRVFTLPAGTDEARRVTLRLRDLDDVPIEVGGAQVAIVSDSGPLQSTVGDVVDHGDGSYSFEVTAGPASGTDVLRLRVDDGAGAVVLYPHVRVNLVEGAELAASVDELDASAGGRLTFWLDAGERRASTPFALLAQGRIVGATGRLDAAGRARVDLEFPPGQLERLVGESLEWHFATLDAPGGGPRADAAVAVAVVP